MASYTLIHDLNIFKDCEDAEKVSLDFAKKLDSIDPLSSLADNFLIPLRSHKSHKHLDKKSDAVNKVADGDDKDDEGDQGNSKTNNKTSDNDKSVYMNGNSLGCQPKKTKEYLNHVADDWAKKGLGMHFDGAFLPALYCDEIIRQSMGKLVGSKFPEKEIVIMNGLTVNLHLFMSSFYRPQGKKTKILLEEKAFPSDHYACESQVRLANLDPAEELILLKSQQEDDGFYLSSERIIEAIKKHKDEIALILLPGVQYKTGQYFEMEKITKIAKSYNINIGWDLAHAAGNVPVKLSEWNVDFAVWCSYKYLNSGAGGIAAAFLHHKHATDFDRPRMLGWFGHKLKTRFEMNNQMEFECGALSYRLCNPPPLLVAPLKASLDVFDQTSIEQLRQKSILLTGYLEYLIETLFEKQQIEIITCKDHRQRGAQLSMKINFGRDINYVENFLTDQGIFCDSRHDIVRIAPAPLYNSFEDVWRVIDAFYFLINGKRIS